MRRLPSPPSRNTRRARRGGVTCNPFSVFAAELGTRARIGCHTFRATGITAYLEAGGTLERAAQMANHTSTRTTQLYDRPAKEVTLDEVERITKRQSPDRGRDDPGHR